MTARHHRHAAVAGAVLALAVSGHVAAASSTSWSPGPASWQGDLTPIAAADWSYDRAAHLLGRAGFSGPPEEIWKLAGMTPEQAVRSLVHYDQIPNDHLQPFMHSGFWDETLIPFPPSRPAATDLALRQGESMGVRVKPEHVNRHVQPVSDRFFYWLRATALETRRVGYWWAERMLDTDRPLQEKMALFWHGHFATAQGKVRDYRKMLLQIEMFERHATGNFGELLVAVARDPGMLYYLDAGVNVKGAANENFAREVMELFTMGDPSPALRAELGAILRDNGFELRPLLETLFLSRDFYSAASYGAHTKGAVVHVVTMLEQLGAEDVPGVPDFNDSTIALGQHLLNPPSVAGWPQGRSWITPALLQERGNVAFNYLFPDIVGFRDPNFLTRRRDGLVGERLRRGHDFGAAIALDNVDDPGRMSAEDLALLERDELFNTRVSDYIAWAQVFRTLIPTPRGAARIDLAQAVLGSGAATTGEAVDYLLRRFLRMPVSPDTRDALVALLDDELGTSDLIRARTYLEDPLRMVTHLIMSTPEYQVN